jgi:long-chain acyl-CoA synthetase
VSLTRYREKLYRRLEKHGKPLPEGFVRPTTEQRKKARLMFPLVSFLRKKIIAEVLGRKVRYIATGGSALAYQVGEFYEALGIEVIQGFGTTELGIPISQLPDGISGYVKVPGTVGSALDRAKVFYWIDPATSELIVSSPTIMMGYAGDPAKTSGVIEIINGRRAYHTGDFAREVGGSIELSGRIDRIYNNLGGEKVSPEGIEKRIEESPYVAYALVWGDGKTHNVAVISPEELSARAWAESRGLRFEDLATSEEFRREIERHIETNVNPNGRSWERVHGVIIADEPFSSANGLLTSSGKVRPKEVLRVYRDKIEALC